MNDSGIEWCDKTWNPIVGCTHGCKFCYARRIMKRRRPGTRRDAEGRLENYGCQACYSFVPHLHPERLDQPARVKAPRIVFCGSVTDLWDPEVRPEWRLAVFGAMNAAPWHHYVVLTKRPDLVDSAELWAQTYRLGDSDAGPGAIWLGVSVTCDDDWWRIRRLVEIARIAPHPILMSIEPLLGPITPRVPYQLSWIIVGAQTGAGATAPEAGWVRDIWCQADAMQIPCFEKDNLARTIGGPLHQDWPEWMALETGRVAARA